MKRRNTLHSNPDGAVNTNIPYLRISDENSGVQVVVQRHFPHLTSSLEAKNSWLSYVWNKGGGLPIWVIPRYIGNEEEDDISNNMVSELHINKSRLIFPVLMEEKLIYDGYDQDESKDIVVKYKVTNAGLLSSEIIPNSHSGTLSFSSSSSSGGQVSGVSMTWKVIFDVTNPSRRDFWQFITKNMITDASNNFSSYLATPILYIRRTKLYSKPDSSLLTPQLALESWKEFCWKEGAGMPLVPPLIFDKDDAEVRYIVPPFLKERILSSKCVTKYARNSDDINDVDDVDEFRPYCELVYTVDNPGITTYQVHSHIGRITFSQNPPESNQIDMKWEIQIRPYHKWCNFVKIFTSFIISSYARNFKCHLLDGGDAMVSIKPPRGRFGGKTLLDMRKDSYLGGILDAHLHDNRTVVEQTLSMLQPWTWGRKDDEGDGESWSEGQLMQNNDF